MIARGDLVTNQKKPPVITATELKQNLGKFLDYVKDYNDVVITKNNHKIARLTPYITSLERYLYFREEALDYSIGGTEVSYEEFMEIAEKSELRLEYINGEIFVLSSPSIKHQRISGKLYLLFSEYLLGKTCQVFYAPFDVHLFKPEFKDPDVVQPDLLIACDIDETTPEDQRYMGTPTLVVEILSPSTRKNDLTSKLQSYMLAGVAEYWIVDPDKENVMVYAFKDQESIDVQTCKIGDQIRSMPFTDLQVEIADIFKR